MADKFPIEKAQEIRAHRAQLLERLEAGSLSPVEILRKPPEVLKGTDIWDLLLACQGIGRETAKKILQDAVIWPHTKLGMLLKSETKRIIEHLPERVL